MWKIHFLLSRPSAQARVYLRKRAVRPNKAPTNCVRFMCRILIIAHPHRNEHTHKQIVDKYYIYIVVYFVYVVLLLYYSMQSCDQTHFPYFCLINFGVFCAPNIFCSVHSARLYMVYIWGLCISSICVRNTCSYTNTHTHSYTCYVSVWRSHGASARRSRASRFCYANRYINNKMCALRRAAAVDVACIAAGMLWNVENKN